MGVITRSVSLDDYVAERVQAAADEDGVSFSSWLSSAAEHRLLLRENLSGIRDWEAEVVRTFQLTRWSNGRYAV